jgi:dienelactone hydrolase
METFEIEYSASGQGLIGFLATPGGYVAFAMDYAGQLLTEVDAVMQRVQERGADPGLVREACRTAHEVLGGRSVVDLRRVVGLGYCFGGQALVEYARTGAALRAIVGFHSDLSVNRPEESRRICARLLMCCGAADPITTVEHRRAFEEEMTAAGVDWRLVTFGNVQHSSRTPRWTR